MLRVIRKLVAKHGKRPIYVAALGDTKGRRNARATPLVFLGKVARSFDSFNDVWKYLPLTVRKTKDVRRQRLGDLYAPALVRTFKRCGRIENNRFAAAFAHIDRKNYAKDIRQSKPIVFREWRAWPDADAYLNNKRLQRLSLPKHFRAMIRKPRPAAYGWKFRLAELKAILAL
jgi:hypothetical protein